jgi:hypothetical protein
MLTAEQKRQIAADSGLVNVQAIWDSSAKAGLPFYIACALMEKESHGRNVYGNDSGGALAGYPREVTRSNWLVFRWLVFSEGMPSNGVGPAQITFRGYFPQMEEEGLRPWNVGDNMFFGFRLLKGHLAIADGDLVKAGTAYNGSRAYGEALATKAAAWKLLIQR